jgi:hypothetical protein
MPFGVSRKYRAPWGAHVPIGVAIVGTPAGRIVVSGAGPAGTLGGTGVGAVAAGGTVTGGTTAGGATTFGVYGVPMAGGATGAGSENTGGACTLPIGAPMPVGAEIGGSDGAMLVPGGGVVTTGAPTGGAVTTGAPGAGAVTTGASGDVTTGGGAGSPGQMKNRSPVGSIRGPCQLAQPPIATTSPTRPTARTAFRLVVRKDIQHWPSMPARRENSYI